MGKRYVDDSGAEVLVTKASGREGGVVEMYWGAKSMGEMGRKDARPDVAPSALMGAVKQREALKALYGRSVACGGVALHFGSGLDSGPVVAGNFGSGKRME